MWLDERRNKHSLDFLFVDRTSKVVYIADHSFQLLFRSFLVPISFDSRPNEQRPAESKGQGGGQGCEPPSLPLSFQVFRLIIVCVFGSRIRARTHAHTHIDRERMPPRTWPDFTSFALAPSIYRRGGCGDSGVHCLAAHLCKIGGREGRCVAWANHGLSHEGCRKMEVAKLIMMDDGWSVSNVPHGPLSPSLSSVGLVPSHIDKLANSRTTRRFGPSPFLFFLSLSF